MKTHYPHIASLCREIPTTRYPIQNDYRWNRMHRKCLQRLKNYILNHQKRAERDTKSCKQTDIKKYADSRGISSHNNLTYLCASPFFTRLPRVPALFIRCRSVQTSFKDRFRTVLNIQAVGGVLVSSPLQQLFSSLQMRLARSVARLPRPLWLASLSSAVRQIMS